MSPGEEIFVGVMAAFTVGMFVGAAWDNLMHRIAQPRGDR